MCDENSMKNLGMVGLSCLLILFNTFFFYKRAYQKKKINKL